MIRKLTRVAIITWVFFMVHLGHGSSLQAQTTGQTIYVPVYSHIYGGPKSRSLDLTATLSIRNTDLAEPLILTSVRYYDSDGKLVKDYLQQEQLLGRLATTHFIVEERDTSGGSGAKFIVQWRSPKPISPPLVECVMVTTHSGLGISFLSQGRVIADTNKHRSDK